MAQQDKAAAGMTARMMVEATVRVTVIYALPERSWHESLCVPRGATLRDAVRASGFARAFPDVDMQALHLGVYGERSAPERIAADGDRVEIYRPLHFDPMESRRRRAAHRARTVNTDKHQQTTPPD